jgi:Protein of unknown function (DUF2442)
MADHKILTTDKDIERALQSASSSDEPTLTALELKDDKEGRLLSLRMSDGSLHLIPVERVEGLSASSPEAILRFEITEDGFGVRWPELDLDLYVPELVQGIYGTKKWMSSLGRRGGKSRSVAKSRAARENGRKGGRPRKHRISEPANSSQEQYSVHKHPQGAASIGYTSLPLRDGTLQHSRGDFAFIFGFDEETSSRPLPRIA